MTEIYKSIDHLVTNPDFSNVTQLSRDFLNAMTNFVGFQKISFGISASAEGFIAYGTDKSLVKQGIGQAYGEVFAAPGVNGGAVAQMSATSQSLTAVNDARSKHVARLLTSSSSYTTWAAAARAAALSRDTTGGVALAESLWAASNEWTRTGALLGTIITASHDSALAVIPNFDSLYQGTVNSFDAARWSQLKACLGFSFFLAQPADLPFADSVVSAIDSANVMTSRATGVVYALRQAIFLTGAVPMLTAECTSSRKDLFPGDTCTMGVVIRNVGSGVANGNGVDIATNSPLALLTSSTIPVGDLSPGDSVLLTVRARVVWPVGDTTSSYSCIVSAKPSSATALVQMGASSVFAYRTCCAGTTGNTDDSPDDVADISDVFAMVDYLGASIPLSSCPTENDVNKDGTVDISDLFALIDYLSGTAPLALCP